MLIDKSISAADRAICQNISYIKDDRGMLSQNILSQLRNLVESVTMKILSDDNDINPYDYSKRQEYLKELRTKGNLTFLHHFHELLQISVSHYTENEDGSERLMLKYYEYLIKMKKYLRENYNIDILKNIEDFPIYKDSQLSDYYSKIADRINNPSSKTIPVEYTDRYYIQKIKPFFRGEEIYYEVTFNMAFSTTSKFDRVIAFTKKEINDNYAVKFSIHSDTIMVLNKEVSVLIIDDFTVAIRPCEIKNYSKIFGENITCNTNSYEYRFLMQFLTETKVSLTDLVSSDQEYYDVIKSKVLHRSMAPKIYSILDKSREIILNDENGTNILRYLLLRMNNRIIKTQLSDNTCYLLSDLYLGFGSIPFDQMPYSSSLIGHNPRHYDLLNSIPIEGREYEFLAKSIMNNTEIERQIFTPKEQLERFNDVEDLVDTFNSHLYLPKHKGRTLKMFNKHVYMEQYLTDTTNILKQLQNYSSEGVQHYSQSVQYWLDHTNHGIDDDVKVEALLTMFSNSTVGFIYGSAGTGKTTLITHFADFFADKEKLFLANTHPALGNLKKRINIEKSHFSTIHSFLSKKYISDTYDIVFIDECSTVSNRDMQKILQKANFKLLILVGDTYQIESIYFGNWFNLAKLYVPSHSVFELDRPYRTNDDQLVNLWSKVRNNAKDIAEYLVSYDFVSKLDESVFIPRSSDEIILCLNYDGLYGINNINRFMQGANPNLKVIWGINAYKAGDPILFNEFNMFSPLIHNNTKGKIIRIQKNEEEIFFEVQVEKAINEIDALGYSFKLLDVSDDGKSTISFTINKYKSTDDDEEDNSTIIPFQVAYAVSIHKAQGLEYDSVKIVLSNEVDERVSHNIFYTSITRAKKNLKIYWSPETENKVLSSFNLNKSYKDSILLSQFSGLKIQNNKNKQ
ncbi:ATP-dependent RecD-like DNA helicase [Aerococcaceae bacterium 50-4]